METELKWYQKPITVILFLIFFFPVGLYLMWKHKLWSTTIRVLISCLIGFFLILNGKDDNSANSTKVDEQKVTTNTVSFSEAQNFMEDRFGKINQTLLESKVVVFDGIKCYLFLSIAGNGILCVSMISELELNVISSECGGEEKLEEWYELSIIE